MHNFEKNKIQNKNRSNIRVKLAKKLFMLFIQVCLWNNLVEFTKNFYF